MPNGSEIKSITISPEIKSVEDKSLGLGVYTDNFNSTYTPNNDGTPGGGPVACCCCGGGGATAYEDEEEIKL